MEQVAVMQVSSLYVRISCDVGCDMLLPFPRSFLVNDAPLEYLLRSQDYQDV